MNGKAWVKRSGQFDVTMGSYDGAETCELVSTYMLAKLKETLGSSIEIGLYRDDGLAIVNGTARETENEKKKICKCFQECGLRITVEANKKVVNYLDVTFDLNSQSYKPYMKPGNMPRYVNIQSNHPKAVLRAIPESVNNRLSAISANEESFNDAVAPYQKALDESGYMHQLKYKANSDGTGNDTQNQKKRARKRKITWFNPPYDARVTTPVGKTFLKIIDECFPNGHKLKKIFNRNTIKISYSCMPNVKNIVQQLNTRKGIPQPKAKAAGCNCRQKPECPMSGNCLEKEIIYKATVESKKGEESYVGLTENTFKTRYGNHKQSFKKRELSNATELSKYIWKLKDAKEEYKISWEIISKGTTYNNRTKYCGLCNLEKYFIIREGAGTLNRRFEMVSACRHARKYLLAHQ